MTTRKVKLCGLNDADSRSFKSMLSVSNDHLLTQWEIVNSEPADLYVYSFETEEGVTAWSNHQAGNLSALLSHQDDTVEGITLIIKKPLRTKSFSTILNEVEKKIISSTQSSGNNKLNKSNAFSISSIFNRLSGSKTATPLLQFTLPEQHDDKSTPVEPATLEKLLTSLTHKNRIAAAEEILANLLRLNQTKIPIEKRFKSLEVYATHICSLITHEQSERHKLKQGSHADYIKTIKAFSSLLTALYSGYLIIIDYLNQHSKKPTLKNGGLAAINCAAQYIEQSILHAYSYYFVPAINSFQTLHQLFLYCEFHGVLNDQIQSNTSLSSFSEHYHTVLLTGIANPSTLTISELDKLPKLLRRFASKIQISTLAEDQEPSGSLKYFGIDLASDDPAKLYSNPKTNTIRTFSTTPMLLAIEQAFNHPNDITDIDLLKKITPQFNTSYVQRAERKPIKGSQKTELLLTVTGIHDYLTTKKRSNAYRASIHDVSIKGMMVSSDQLDSYSLAIGNLVGIADDKSEHKLAIVRWMTRNNEGISHIGLEFQATPTPVTMTLENKTDSFIGLLLSQKPSVKTMLVSKETYLPLQPIKVKEGPNVYRIVIDSEIQGELNCKQFSFTIKP